METVAKVWVFPEENPIFRSRRNEEQTIDIRHFYIVKMLLTRRYRVSGVYRDRQNHVANIVSYSSVAYVIQRIA